MIKIIKAAINHPIYKSIATYIFSNFFSKGISLLLIFVFTNPRYLTPSDNGILSLFSSNLMLMSPFVSLGMIQSAGADFFKKEQQEFKTTFATNFFISFSLAFFSFLLLLLFKDELQAKFEMPSSFIYLIPFLAFLVFCSEQLFILVRNRAEVKRFAALSVIKALIEYGVSVLLVIFLFKGWQGRVIGIAVSLIAINLLGIFYYLKHGYLSFTVNKKHVLNEIKFGLPFIVFQVCVFLLGSTNKLFLAIFDVDKAELGIYAVACVFGTLVGNLGQSIFLYVQPKAYESISSGNASLHSLQKSFTGYFKMLLAVSIPCIIAVVLVYEFLINKIYLPGIRLFFIISLATFIWQLNYFLFSFLLYYKAKRKILSIAIASIIISCIINILMVKHFMIIGDALASLINTCIFSLLVFFPVRKLLLSKFETKSSPVKKFKIVTPKFSFTTK